MSVERPEPLRYPLLELNTYSIPVPAPGSDKPSTPVIEVAMTALPPYPLMNLSPEEAREIGTWLIQAADFHESTCASDDAR